MTPITELDITTKLTFSSAGVTFILKCNSAKTGSGSKTANFTVSAVNAVSLETLKLNEDTSPQLVDWAKGYSRWLTRANVIADYNDDGILGTVKEGITIAETLTGIQAACDMISQRFDHYESSILA
tara:strand:+ start:555 stop:932 length:378 start_codon:yes stop_codon:yes gene_type:complete